MHSLYSVPVIAPPVQPDNPQYGVPSDHSTVVAVPLAQGKVLETREYISRTFRPLPKTSVLSANLKELDKSVKEMMETSENMIQDGKCQKRAEICKVCGKEGSYTNIKSHIEAKHLEGVSIPCKLCEKILRSRHALSNHILRYHKER